MGDTLEQRYAAAVNALAEAHDALQETFSGGEGWDDLYEMTGNPSWEGLKERIGAVLDRPEAKALLQAQQEEVTG